MHRSSVLYFLTSGLPKISTSGISAIQTANCLVPSIIFLLYSAYFRLPVNYITNHAPLIATPDRDPARVAAGYTPPDQVDNAKNAYYLRFFDLKRTVDTPFGAMPYLC